MKKYLLLLLIFFPLTSFASCGTAGFSYSKSLTINHLKVGGTVATPVNFPVVATSTDANLKTVGNGGHVQNANGYDIYFYSDSGCNTRIPAEREYYLASTGQNVFWIKAATLSTTTDTVVYMAYGNPAISTDPNLDATYGATSVWDSNYKETLHLPNGATLSALDSTSNANNGTVSGATATAGQLDGAALFNTNTNVDYIATPSLNLGTSFTVEAWAKPTAGQASSGNYNRIAENLYSSGFYLGKNPGGGYLFIVNNNFSLVGGSLVDGTWNHVVGTFDGTTAKLYVDGVSVGTPQTPGSPTVGSHVIRWGMNANANQEGWNGALDELRLSVVGRSADWITTEYNNQSNVNTFITFGSEVASSPFMVRLSALLSRLSIFSRLILN